MKEEEQDCSGLHFPISVEHIDGNSRRFTAMDPNGFLVNCVVLSAPTDSRNAGKLLPIYHPEKL